MSDGPLWEDMDLQDRESLEDDNDLKLVRETFRVRLMGYFATLAGALLMIWAIIICLLGFLGYD
jgi:hypothetical protein